MVEALDWLNRAKSNLSFGKMVHDEDSILFGGDIYFEDPCFELQQCAEKSLKAVLIFHGVKFPKTHVIAELFDILKDNSVEIPDDILIASELTQYAVRTRYPDDFRRITKEEYLEVVSIAERTYNWAKEYLQKRLKDLI